MVASKAIVSERDIVKTAIKNSKQVCSIEEAALNLPKDQARSKKSAKAGKQGSLGVR